MYTTLSNNDDIASIVSSLEYVLDHRELHNFARQIAEGMKHLHDMKITHRDLAARNVLIDECKTLKISDFGLSRSGIYVNTKSKPVNTWLMVRSKVSNCWMADRYFRYLFDGSQSNRYETVCIRRKRMFGLTALCCGKSVHWVSACKVFEKLKLWWLWWWSFTGGHPYHTVSNNDLLSYLSAGNRLEKPENCSDYLYSLMLDCWSARADDRPDFTQILTRLDLHDNTYTNFSEISSDYVFPPTKEQIKNNKMNNGLRHWNIFVIVFFSVYVCACVCWIIMQKVNEVDYGFHRLIFN